MNNSISLRIDGKWVSLPEDVEITIEGNSNIWEDKDGTCSYPFEISIEQNRHLIGNSDELRGESIYAALDGKKGELFLMGIPFFVGIVSLDDEVDLDSDVVALNIKSGNLAFEKQIEGLNCRDVPLMDEIIVGTLYKYVVMETVAENDSEMKAVNIKVDLPEDDFLFANKATGDSLINVSDPYPIKKYCNVRLCYGGEETGEGEYTTENTPATRGRVQGRPTGYARRSTVGSGISNPSAYVVLEADRSKSGPCFYVMYFLDCLFYHLQVNVEENKLGTMEDMNRLAFFNTRLSFKSTPGIADSLSPPTFIKDLETEFNIGYKPHRGKDLYYYGSEVIADSKNFPDVEVQELIESLSAAFGVKILYDNKSNSVRLFYIKDLFSVNTENLRPLFVYDISKVEAKDTLGFQLSYSSGEDDDTAFNYTDYSNVEEKQYADIIKNIGTYDKTCYIDPKTGNAYRIKVNKDAEKPSELFPSLFEVGAFNPANDGDVSNEEYVEKKEVAFIPVIMNDTGYAKAYRAASGRNEDGTTGSEVSSQALAVFLDVDMQGEGKTILSQEGWMTHPFKRGMITYNYKISYTNKQRYDIDSHDESPIQSYDTGFSLFVMRGPGNESGVELYDYNYDDEGNSKYVQVPKNYACSPDTVDNYGNLFDYNGKEEGGVDVSGRFSLKPRAEKPGYAITSTYAQKRGLADKFYAEYSYFVRNRKVAKILCKMELADIVNLSWEKKYRIGDVVGFLKSYSYTVTKDGVSPVSLELYYI